MVTPTAANRARDAIVRLGHRGLDVGSYAEQVGRTLTGVVPAEGTCLMTVDPATSLPTAEYVENGMPAPALLRMVDIELREPDVNKWVDLTPAASAASLSDATRGELGLSLRQREIRDPGGFSDELRVLLCTGTGSWGQLTVFREARRPYFTSADVAFVSTVASSIGDGLRRSMLLDRAAAGSTDVGVVVLDVDDAVTMVNPAADQWLADLGTDARLGSRLPVVVAAVAHQARTVTLDNVDNPAPAVARARTRTGGWLFVRASLMGHRLDDPVTVMLEPAARTAMAPLMVQAYGFTDAERRVTELVAQGLSTRDIAKRLVVSSYTVQDHLKSIFTKSDTGSRGDLVARLFVDHYAAGLTGAPSDGADS